MDLKGNKLASLDVSRRVHVTKNNNLDLLRFCFAFIVFLVHAYQLSGVDTLSIFNKILSSRVAVECFFIVSGFLIFMSYEYSDNVKNYFEKRVRRIYPAYFLVILSCAFFGSLLTTYNYSNYFFNDELFRYILANLVFLNFLQPDLPGVFSNNELSAVNGALWTLKIEVMFYLSVPIFIWLFRRVGLKPTLMGIYLLSYLYSFSMQLLANKYGGIFSELQRQLPGQLMFFIAGGGLYYFLESFKKNSKRLVLIALCFLFIEHYLELGILYPASLAVIVIYFGVVFKFIGNFGRFGDFSYGIYILHFPIIQTLVAYQLFTASPYFAMLFATTSVLITAYVMWHWVEKPVLKKSSHYLKVSGHAS